MISKKNMIQSLYNSIEDAESELVAIVESSKPEEGRAHMLIFSRAHMLIFSTLHMAIEYNSLVEGNPDHPPINMLDLGNKLSLILYKK